MVSIASIGSTTSATVSRTVPVPVREVWDVLADHEGMRGWAPGLSVELARSGTATRNGVGAVRRITTPLPLPGIVEEIVAFDPPRRLGYRAVAGVPLRNYRGEVELDAHGDGTRISYTIAADRRLPLADDLATRVVARTLLALLVRRLRRR